QRNSSPSLSARRQLDDGDRHVHESLSYLHRCADLRRDVAERVRPDRLNEGGPSFRATFVVQHGSRFAARLAVRILCTASFTRAANALSLIRASTASYIGSADDTVFAMIMSPPACRNCSARAPGGMARTAT